MNNGFKCAKCGADLSADDLSCEQCGAAVSSFDLEDGSSNKPSKVVSLIILLSIALVVTLVIILSNSKPDDTSPPKIPTAEMSIEDEIKSLEELYQAHPDHAPIALRLGNLYASRKNHRKAIRYYRSFLSIDTSNAGWEVKLDLAKSLFALRKTDEAKSELNSILKIDPSHDGALYNLGAIEANLGNSAEAHRMWTQLLEHHSNGRMAELARNGLSRLNSND